MERLKICECCGKEFIAKSSLARYCSHNCRMKGYYHQKNPNAINYIMGKTDEEKKKERADYQRNRYQQDEEFREKHKAMRRKSYYKHKDDNIVN